LKTIHEKNLEHILALNPRQLWHFFAELSVIPRGSKNEKAVTEYLQKFANEYDLDIKVDKSGNVVISVPATHGKENVPSVCLQAHVDMVCEKTPESTHDFRTDPIEFVLLDDSTKLKAKDTSLGADNGIGVAAMLTIAENPDIEHGPIELLFTVDEETGLNGANAIPEGFIRSKIVINLDSEDWGEIFMSCSGCLRTIGKIPLKLPDSAIKDSGLKIIVKGLKGGHSGVDIHIPHKNPIQILARCLYDICVCKDIALIDIGGGKSINAIPRDAYALINVYEGDVPSIKAEIENFYNVVKEEISFYEPDFEIEVIEENTFGLKACSDDDLNLLLSLLVNIPHGVIMMSALVPGLVQTSTNLGKVSIEDGCFVFQTMQRSSIDSELLDLGQRIEILFNILGGSAEHNTFYTGWKADPNSPILNLAKKTYSEMFNEKPKVVAIHAGLECGVIAGKFPGTDIISFGPTIRKPHSPNEYVDIATVEKFYNFLLAVLKNIT
jgi:dipeptidase D